VTDSSQTTPEPQPASSELSQPVTRKEGPRSPLVIFAVIALVVAAGLTVWMLTRPKGGLYGQILINGEPARRQPVELAVVKDGGKPETYSLKTDAQGYYKIQLRGGQYGLRNPNSDPGMLKVGADTLEIIQKSSPFGKTFDVADTVLDVPPVRVGRPGRILGPLEGAIIMPDEPFSWVPYPNASRYVIELLYFDTGSRVATASIYLDGERDSWAYTLTDEAGRPIGTESFRLVNPQHPTRSLIPGGVYRWTMHVFNEDGSLKTTTKPVSFSVSNTDEAKAVVASREAASILELNKKMGLLTGRITKTGLPVKNATFHITVDRVDRQTNQRTTFPYLKASTDEEGGFELPFEAGVYSVVEIRPQPGDTIFDTMGEGAIVVPGAPAAIYEVVAGQKAVIPDVRVVSSVKVKYPKNGQKNVDRKPTIEWEKFEDANRYQLTLHYIDEREQRSAVLIVVTNTTSYSIEKVNLPAEMAEQLKHPVEGLKPGGHYAYQLLASKEPEQGLFADRNKPPPQWIRMSESLWTDFYVKK